MHCANTFRWYVRNNASFGSRNRVCIFYIPPFHGFDLWTYIIFPKLPIIYGPCPIVTRVIYFAFLLTFFGVWYIVENILLFSIISYSIFTGYYDKNVYNELLVLKNCERNFTNCKSWDCEQNSPPNHLQLVLYTG